MANSLADGENSSRLCQSSKLRIRHAGRISLSRSFIVRSCRNELNHFQIFDIPSKGSEPFEKRIDHLKKLFGPGGSHASKELEVVTHKLAKNRKHVLDKLKEIESLGGEGLMLRKAGS